MRRALAPAVAALALVSACAPAPRSQAYYAAHPTDAERTLAHCRSGSARGADCANAERGRAAREGAERLALYRRTFAP